jgi:hypothetical protein
LAKVTLLLVYAADRPQGDLADRLELQLCLTPQGQIDEPAFALAPLPWLARRILPDGTGHTGEVVPRDGGWALRHAHSEDAPLWALEGRVFRPGELVSLRRPDGEELVFRVVNVEPD